MADDNGGSGLYTNWNISLRKRYIRLLDTLIYTVENSPIGKRITDVDVKNLTEALIALDASDSDIQELIERYKEQGWLETDEDGNIDFYDPDTFAVLKGIVRGLAIRKIEKGELKPGNPLEKDLEKAALQWKDLEFEED